MSLIFAQCSVGVDFNTVVDGKEYDDDVVLNIKNISFCFSKLSVTNYHHSPAIEIDIINNSNDTLFYNPTKIILYKDKELFQNEYGNDSIYSILPSEEKEIYYFSENWIFEVDDYTPYIEGKLEPKEIKFGLLIEGFQTCKSKIDFPLIRFVPENDKAFKPYKFLVN
ncbi:MAG: hypothetical protein WAU11_11005 [Ignavibacteriaceae bacterium]